MVVQVKDATEVRFGDFVLVGPVSSSDKVSQLDGLAHSGNVGGPCPRRTALRRKDKGLFRTMQSSKWVTFPYVS